MRVLRVLRVRVRGVEGEALIKNYHDPDFARIPLAHQVV